MLKPITKQSLSDQVFEQLRDLIVTGEVEAGSDLPSERVLSEKLAVSRGAVREALKQLAQARLVSIQHGGATRVLDYRASGGLDLLSALLVGADGQLRTKVVRSIMEMRSLMAPDIARLAAKRGGEILADALDDLVAAMAAARGDDARQQSLATQYWDLLVDGSANVAYRLAYNSLIESYRHYDTLLTHVLAAEHSATDLYAEIAEAVRRQEPETARAAAETLSRRGQASMEQLLAALAQEP